MKGPGRKLEERAKAVGGPLVKVIEQLANVGDGRIVPRWTPQGSTCKFCR